MGIAAFIALWRYKIGIMLVIAASGIIGLAYTLLKPLLIA
jgi:uncharacterized protein involved in exopolysaccharide biosynthesis